MLLLIICNNNNSFVLLWLWIIIAITLFIQNIFIYWYFWYFLKSPVTFTLTSIYTLSTLFTFILHPHFYIYISFHHIGQALSNSQNHLSVWCLVTLNEIFFLRSQKGDCIAGVNYLKGVFALFGPRPPVFISGPQLPNPIKISTSSTSSYLDPSHYDHVHITFNGLQVICFMFTYSCYI